MLDFLWFSFVLDWLVILISLVSLRFIPISIYIHISHPNKIQTHIRLPKRDTMYQAFCVLNALSYGHVNGNSKKRPILKRTFSTFSIRTKDILPFSPIQYRLTVADLLSWKVEVSQEDFDLGDLLIGRTLQGFELWPKIYNFSFNSIEERYW